MHEDTAFTPLGEAFALFARPPALVALLVLLVLYAFNGFGMASAMAAMRDGSRGGAAMIGLYSMLGGFVLFLATAFVQFQLSRRLGDDVGMPGRADIGFWIGITIAYGVVSGLWQMLFTLIAAPAMATRETVQYYPVVLGLSLLVFRTIVFPVLVRLVAAAHSGSELKLGPIWSALWSRRIGWLAIYVLLGAAVVALGFLPNLLTAALNETGGILAILPRALIGAAGQVLLLLYAIATYRALRRAAGGGPSDVFS